jgi:myo-inositol-1(or 4)-monophosphatase
MDLKCYREFTEGMAEEAGSLLNNYLGRISSISYKGRMNLVTDVDRRCERLILKKIKAKYPHHAVLSEESGRSGTQGSDFLWIIDPLDGTTNYAHSFPFFCVSIALFHNNTPLIGVCYDPIREELFFAINGMGAFLNKKIIKVSKIKNLKRCLVATGFPYRFGQAMRQNIDNFKSFMMKAQAVRRAGSAALDLCYVACGRFDGFWEMDLKPWDTAAGALIVKEAGGKVTTFKGDAFNPYKDEIIASNSLIHSQMIKVLR